MSGRSSSKRWTSAGEAARILRQKFLSGEIDVSNLNCELIQNSHESFLQYDNKTFRSNLTRLAQSIIDAGGIQMWAQENQGKIKQSITLN